MSWYEEMQAFVSSALKMPAKVRRDPSVWMGRSPPTPGGLRIVVWPPGYQAVDYVVEPDDFERRPAFHVERIRVGLGEAQDRKLLTPVGEKRKAYYDDVKG